MNTVSSFWFWQHEPQWLKDGLSYFLTWEKQNNMIAHKITEWHAYQRLLKRWFAQRQDMAKLRDQDYG